MDTSFWLRKWRKNEIGFHESDTNPLLTQYFHELSLKKGGRVFVPLCGKTLDIRWLLSKGYRVVGAELSKIATDQLFWELGVTPDISQVGNLKHYKAKDIDLFVGDIFDLSKTTLGPVDVIYDRAALVALPLKIREKYTAHLMRITNMAPQLLISYDYDQNMREGPPFSVSNSEVQQHYGASYQLTLLSSIPVSGGLKGKCAAQENIWLLSNH